MPPPEANASSDPETTSPIWSLAVRSSENLLALIDSEQGRQPEIRWAKKYA